MTSAMFAVADWLCTFALHSTIALGLALLVPALLRHRALAWQEALLRVSLWGALFSSALQCTVLGNVWSTDFVLPVAAPSSLGASFGSEIVAAATAPIVDGHVALATGLSTSALILLAAAVAAAFGLGWLFRVQRRLARVLRTRQPETDARVLATAAEVARELGLRQSPHVSRCPRLATPIAFGSFRPEICLPVRAATMDGDSLRAMLAHEIEHLRRGDPMWIWLAAWIQALFPWQPLLCVVRRKWVRLVELRCDAVAARHSSPTAVARCLVDVAEWLRTDRPDPVVALGMAARPSALRERVESVLCTTIVRTPGRVGVGAVSALSLSALTLAAPGITTLSPSASEFVLAPVPAAVGESAAVSFLATLQMLRAEQQGLIAEADRLSADMRRGFSTPELQQMQATLRLRLLDLDRSCGRLEALLERRAPRFR